MSQAINILLLVGCMVFSVESTAEIYKCVIGEKEVLQDLPCQDGFEEIFEVEVKNDPPASISSWENKLISQRKIAIGMTVKALVLSWGRPTKVNRSGLGSDQWIYERGNYVTQYVYVENGLVTNWQN